jgi:hypothetical protein
VGGKQEQFRVLPSVVLSLYNLKMLLQAEEETKETLDKERRGPAR